MSEQSSDRAARARRAAAAEAREYALGNLSDVSHQDVDAQAGIVRDDDVRELLTFARQAWKRHGDDTAFRETRWARNRIETAASAYLTDAIEAGNLSQLEYLTGSVEYQNDVSGLHTAAKLEDWLCRGEATSLVYFAGLMGRGKTDLSLSLLQVVAHYHDRLRDLVGAVDDETPDDVDASVSTDDLADVEFAANFEVRTPEGEPDVLEIDNFDELIEWTDGHDSDDDLWMIFDEASTELTAQSGANAQDVAEVMVPFIKKMRKLGVNMIIIGHDRGDIHKGIRVLCDFVDKTSLKAASVYETIKNREPSGHLFDLDNIPQTDWEFDTNDMATWDWGSALDDEDIQDDGLDVLSSQEFKEWRNQRIRTLYDDYGLTQSNVAEVMGLDQGTVSRIL